MTQAHDQAVPTRNHALEAHLRQRPVVLNVETINVCNARCVFCAYPKSQRPKQQMPLHLFEKIISEFSAMGGGALLLTPIIGDFFLDSCWRQRVQIARRYENIGMISVTTNGIALDRAGEENLAYFLEHTDFLQFSIGGVSREGYREMFGVDRFDRARANAIALAELRNRVRPTDPLRLAFRVTDPALIRQSKETEVFKKLGYEIVIENQFGNWGGIIKPSDLPSGAVLRRPLSFREKQNPCFVFYLGLFVASSGKVTICGCMDAEVEETIGDCATENLKDIWHKQRYQEVKASFGTQQMPDICKRCSFYEDGVKFSLTPEVMAFQSGQYPFGYGPRHRMFEREEIIREDPEA